MDLNLGIEEPRDEGIKDLIYHFILKSVLVRGNVEGSLSRIERLLQNTVVKEKLLKTLEVKYFVVATSRAVTQVGIVEILLDWHAFNLAVTSGKNKFSVSKDDPLGSMSPALNELANVLRSQSIKHGVNDLSWAVTWIDEIYGSEERRNRVNQENGLVKQSEYQGAHADAEAVFDQARKKRIHVNLEVAKEVDFKILWLSE